MQKERSLNKKDPYSTSEPTIRTLIHSVTTAERSNSAIVSFWVEKHATFNPSLSLSLVLFSVFTANIMVPKSRTRDQKVSHKGSLIQRLWELKDKTTLYRLK